MERIAETDVQILETLYKQTGKVEVCKVRMYRTNEILCMKKIYVENVYDATMIQSECLAMAHFDHEHILKLRGASLGGVDREISHILIFMDFFAEGDLEKLIISRIHSRIYFGEEEILNYLIQLVSAYHYMQMKNTAHRDIKPQNIFISDNGENLKVGDLGSAVKKNSNQEGNTLTGTPLYLSPKLREAYMKSNAGNWNIDHNVFKSDVYSLGLTFLYMASLVPVKELANLNDLQAKITRRISDISGMYPVLAEILVKMLSVEEADRVDFIQLKRILEKPSNKIILDEKNVLAFQSGQLDALQAKCEICETIQKENEVYVFTLGLICKKCYQEASENFYPQNP